MQFLPKNSERLRLRWMMPLPTFVGQREMRAGVPATVAKYMIAVRIGVLFLYGCH